MPDRRTTITGVVPSRGGHAWHHDRLVTAVRLLSILPTIPGITTEALCEELEVPPTTLRRLLKAVGDVFDIRSIYQGKRLLFYLPRQVLIDRLFGFNSALPD